MPAVGVPSTVMVTVAFALATDALEMGNISRYPDVNEPSCVRRAAGIVPVPAEASNMQLALRASDLSGYIAGSDKDVALPVASMRASVSYAPLLGGLKAYVFGELASPVHVYVRGELGPLLVINAVNVAAGGLSASASHSSLHFGMAVSAGLETFDMVDLGVGLLVADADHVDQSTALLMTVGCRLPSF